MLKTFEMADGNCKIHQNSNLGLCQTWVLMWYFNEFGIIILEMQPYVNMIFRVVHNKHAKI